MMFASVIMALVFAGVGSAFVGVMRMSKTAVAEAELSLRMRELREKLLFHVAPPHDGTVWAGLLSGEHGIESGVKIRTAADGFELANGSPAAQTIELVRHADQNYFVNDADRIDDDWDRRWLTPGGIAMLPESDALDDSSQADRFLYTVSLESVVGGVSRRERIVVPLFGRQQVKNAGSVFHD